MIREDTQAILKLNHEPLNFTPMGEQVGFTDAPAIRKTSEGCEKRVFQHNRHIPAIHQYLLLGRELGVTIHKNMRSTVNRIVAGANGHKCWRTCESVVTDWQSQTVAV